MFVSGDVVEWMSVVVAAVTCQRMSASSETRPQRQTPAPGPGDIEASVQKTETWQLNKKFTVSSVDSILE